MHSRSIMGGKRQQPQQEDEPWPSSKQQQRQNTMKKGEVGSETDRDPSVLQVPAINWAKYVGVKSVQYIKIRHAPKLDAEEPNDWDLGNAVRETEKQFGTDPQLLKMETTNDPSPLKTLVPPDCQQHENLLED